MIVSNQCNNRPETDDKRFVRKLKELLNIESKEGNSNTPDYILARYLSDCLKAYDDAMGRRKEYYSKD